MPLTKDELTIAVSTLILATDLYELSGRRPKDSLSEHLTYLKQKALITKLQKEVAHL